MPDDFHLRCGADFPMGNPQPATVEDDAPVEERLPDCMFVIGSSLTVFPAATVPDMMSKKATRILVNREPSGRFNFSGERDYFFQGDSDDMILQFLQNVGWLGELEKYRDGMCEKSREAYDRMRGSAAPIPTVEANAISRQASSPRAPTPIVTVAGKFKSGSIRSVCFVTGAGTSVASGIPDFRSPGGMYDTLRPELLTATEEDREIMKGDPTWVVNKDLFMRNSLPYHEVRRPFIIGSGVARWKPTITHWFYRILYDKGLLRTLYTQNIDGLDFMVGLPPEKIVCVHGTIRRAICESCLTDPYDGDFEAYTRDVCTHTKDIYGVDPSAPAESKPIVCRKCGKPTVKPATVLYGGRMPADFHLRCDVDFPTRKGPPVEDDAPVEKRPPDCMFVIGSSLTVFPAATVPEMINGNATRILVNREPAGRFDFSRDRDFFFQGDSDDMILLFLQEVGWLEELEKYRDGMCEKSREAYDRMRRAE